MTNKLTKEQEKRKYIFKSVTDSLPLWLIRDSKVMYRDGYVYIGDITETVADEIASAEKEMLNRVVDFVGVNQKGTFTDDGGNPCWYLDDLQTALSEPNKELMEKLQNEKTGEFKKEETTITLGTEECLKVAQIVYEQYREAMKPPIYIYSSFEDWLKKELKKITEGEK